MPEHRPRVFVARRIPEEGIEAIRAVCDTDLWPDELPPPRDELLRRVAGCDGVLTLLTDRVDDELLDAAGPNLRVVSNYAVGFDNIDVAACTRRGIPVGNTPGVLTETTADLAWALLMAAARRLPEGDRYVRAGNWRTWGPLLLLGPDVHGATIGIVGFGRIGQAVARRAQGFGMEILYHDVNRLPDEVTAGLTGTSSPLGAGATEALWSLLGAFPTGAVVESWWPTDDRALVTAGLLRAGVDPPAVVEVWCEIPAALARERFESRVRHRVHGLQVGLAWWDGPGPAQAQPLGLGPVLRVDTSTPLTPRTVVDVSLRARALVT